MTEIHKCNKTLDVTAFVWRWAYPLIVASFLVLLLNNHIQMITLTVPLDLKEGTITFITGLIAKGVNPYQPEAQPMATYAYPPLYNMLVAPLSLVFGNGFFLHRSVAAFFIVIACAVCGFATYRSCGSRSHSFAAAVLLYGALLFYSTPVSSPNSMGLALFLGSVVWPWAQRFSWNSLCVAVLLGVLAFFSKQYFGAGMAMLTLYLFLFVSMGRAVRFGALFGSIVLVLLIGIYAWIPQFLDNTVFAMARLTFSLDSDGKIPEQLLLFVKVYSGLLIVLTGGAIAGIVRGRQTTEVIPGPGLGLRGFDKPLISAKVDYFWFCFVMSTLLIVLFLGRNPGNYMTYRFQLMSPFLVIAGFAFVAFRSSAIGKTPVL